MRSPEFWDHFDRVVRPKLPNRADGFAKIFSYLDRFDRPVVIVETGCVREKDAWEGDVPWEGDGQSTVLFDQYCAAHPGSILVSVDSDPAATALCRSLVGHSTRIHTGDSIPFLKSLADGRSGNITAIDLLYLDSHDVDFREPLPAALHTFKELLAITPLVSDETLVVVDDAPLSFHGVRVRNGQIRQIGNPVPGGKGMLIGEYAREIGVQPIFAEYQSGWLGLGRRGRAAPGGRPAAEAGRGPAAAGRSREAARRPLKMNDLLSRMTDALPRADRLHLALRLLETDAEQITFRRDGIRWTAFPWDEIISRGLLVDGGWQPVEIDAVVAWLERRGHLVPPRDVIVDVGANIGTSAIPFARQTGGRVIAIEPVPEIFAVLCRNIADNGLADRVACVEMAIGMGPGRARMVLPTSNSGGGEVVRPGEQASFAQSSGIRGMVEVPTMGLSALIAAQGIAPESVALVWSDTQGCEGEVIETGRALWAAGVPLFAEWVPLVWGDPERTRALLAAAGAHFAAFVPAPMLMADAGAAPHPIAELGAFSAALDPRGTDILLLPEGHGR